MLFACAGAAATQLVLETHMAATGTVPKAAVVRPGMKFVPLIIICVAARPNCGLIELITGNGPVKVNTRPLEVPRAS